MSKKAKPPPSSLAVQLRVRMSNRLHRQLETATRQTGRSLNSEILHRLEMTFAADQPDMPKLVAKALLHDLDPKVLGELFPLLVEDRERRALKRVAASDKVPEQLRDRLRAELERLGDKPVPRNVWDMVLQELAHMRGEEWPPPQLPPSRGRA